MKTFKDIYEAIKYCDFCPYCQSHIGRDFLPENGRVKIQSQYSSIIIDCETLQIIETNFSSPHKEIRSIDGEICFERLPDDLLSFGVTTQHIEKIFYCNGCAKYSGWLEFVFDNKSLINIRLKSECFRGLAKEPFDIQNLYYLDKTQITLDKTQITLDNKTLEFPLISENLKNISDVINRVERLMIFA